MFRYSALTIVIIAAQPALAQDICSPIEAYRFGHEGREAPAICASNADYMSEYDRGATDGRAAVSSEIGDGMAGPDMIGNGGNFYFHRHYHGHDGHWHNHQHFHHNDHMGDNHDGHPFNHNHNIDHSGGYAGGGLLGGFHGHGGGGFGGGPMFPGDGGHGFHGGHGGGGHGGGHGH